MEKRNIPSNLHTGTLSSLNAKTLLKAKIFVWAWAYVHACMRMYTYSIYNTDACKATTLES